MKLSGKGAIGLAGALILAAAGGCKGPPTSFGVNLTINARALTATELDAVRVGTLVVTGAEPRVKDLSVYPAITSRQLTFQYIPNITSGTLTFQFDALDTGGKLYGTGTSAPVKLSAGQAASATIVLSALTGSSKGIGAKCNSVGECASGFCVDGVCCQGACQDPCASCGRGDNAGLCTGYDAGTDPEGECVGFSGSGNGATDAGAPMDGAAGQPTNIPDGGLVVNPMKCGGLCSGNKSCNFADAGTTCGDPYCDTRKEVASLICNGQGSCGVGVSTCANGYACDPSGTPSVDCHVNCRSNSDCASGYYCGTGSTCAPTKDDGLTCATDAECVHNHCVGAATGVNGVCCNTVCAAPFTCNNSGSAGTCTCPTVMSMPCKTGVSCVIFYPDFDGDGYGDESASLGSTSNPAVAGCADSPPPNHVTDNTDCDDHDANVHPGQTAFFSTASKGVATFDYNCDGIREKGIPEYPGASCQFCPSACSGNGCSDPASSTCGSANQKASLDCNHEGNYCAVVIKPLQSSVAAEVVTPPITTLQPSCCGCAASDQAGFTATVDCGVSSNTYTTCGTCGSSSGTAVGSSGGTATTTGSKVQTCH